jgi:hypothetical protein
VSKNPRLTPEERAEVIAAAYAMGDLRPALTRTQRLTDKKLSRRRHPLFYLDCSRRWGKTIYLVWCVIRCALSKQNAIIRYAAPTKLHGRTFVKPAMRRMCALLPVHMRPRFVAGDNCWIWPLTGSICYLGSCESIEDADRQVGTDCDLAIVDEGAKINHDILKHWHLTVIVPQFMTTMGTLIVGSTPAINPSHYLTTLRLRAIADDAAVRFTLDDCDHISPEMKQETIDECGGIDTPEAQRELFCNHIPDKNWMVVPEFLDVRDRIVVARERPAFLDWYVCADMGFNDLSAVVFAWYDFPRHVLVIDDELEFHKKSGLEVGYAVKAWEAENKIYRPRRFADGTPQLLADIAHEELGPGVSFGPVMKDGADAAINALRMRIRKLHIEINPRCTGLIEHLSSGVWNKQRTDFARQDGYGHWDFIAALNYLVRLVDWKKDPAPSILPGVTNATHHIPSHIQEQLRRSRAALRQVARR